MASETFNSFVYNLVDVDRLVSSHASLSGTKQGRRGLGHITRSGVVMLCAAWELYIEHLMCEAASCFTDRCTLPTELPGDVQKELSKCVKNSKHELRPLHLSGDGWKNVYTDHVAVAVGRLNSPKSGNINDLAKRLLGVPELSACWAVGANDIDAFVEVRGKIAHRGRQADYIPIHRLREYRDMLRATAVETDNDVSEFLSDNSPVNTKPWRTAQ